MPLAFLVQNFPIIPLVISELENPKNPKQKNNEKTHE
jgi:hypothetical protein